MKFRDIIEVNRSPKIEGMQLYKDTMFMYTSDSLYGFNLNTGIVEEIEFQKK